MTRCTTYRLLGLLGLCMLALSAAHAGALADRLLPAARFRGWSTLQFECTETRIVQVWRQPLSNVPKGVDGYTMVSYQAEQLTSAAEAAKRAQALTQKQRFGDYIAKGYTVSSTLWLSEEQRGIQFTVRGLSHSTSAVTAHRAEIYVFAQAVQDWLLWLEVRQVSTAPELDLSDRALMNAGGKGLADSLLETIIRLWSQPAADETPKPAPAEPTKPATPEPKPAVEPVPVPAAVETPKATDPQPKAEPVIPAEPVKPEPTPQPETPKTELVAQPPVAEPKVETPAPKADPPATPATPAPKVETPVETPTPKVEPPVTPVETPKVETPVTPIETPAPKVNTPAPKVETPAPVVQPEPRPVQEARWLSADKHLSLVLPAGWTATGRDMVTLGDATLAVRLYPVETYADAAELATLIDDFAATQKDISAKGFSRQPFTVDGVTGVQVRYTSLARHTVASWYFGKTGRVWRLDAELPGENAAIPAAITTLVESARVE